jgi:hypothetical protein
MQALASTEPALDFSVEAQKIELAYSNVRSNAIIAFESRPSLPLLCLPL